MRRRTKDAGVRVDGQVRKWHNRSPWRTKFKTSFSGSFKRNIANRTYKMSKSIMLFSRSQTLADEQTQKGTTNSQNSFKVRVLTVALIICLNMMTSTLATSPINDQVDLSKPQDMTTRKTHIYRLKGANFNGKLELPPKLLQANLDTLVNATDMIISEELMATTKSSFGLRSVSSTTKSPTSNSNSSLETSSLAASSPMLHLTTRSQKKLVNRTVDASKQLSEASPKMILKNQKLQVMPTTSAAEFESELLVSSSNRGDRMDVDGQTVNERIGSDSILNLIDEYDFQIVTNRTRAHLSCDSGEMILKLNFSEPFKGIVYPNHNRLSPCRFFGDGHHNYELRLPLRGCGTRQAAPRIFVNDVVVRFHKSLELEEDEVKTLICRYPPPLASSVELESGVGSKSFQWPQGSSDSSILQESQFEFVDPISGQLLASKEHKTPSQEPIGTGHIDALSENLVVAPSGGQLAKDLDRNSQMINFNGRQGSLPSQPILDPYGMAKISANSRASSRINQPPDIFKQRNSIVIDPNEAVVNMNLANNTQRNFFERLSSIELLFLISSLMFLALLALGLATSYYCFRRQNRGRPGQASAILRQKRRFPPPPPTLAPDALRQYRQQQVAASPSSPESDLSGRNLLLGASHQNTWRSPDGVISYADRSMAQKRFAIQPQAGVFTDGDLASRRIANGIGRSEQQQVPVLGRREGIRNKGFVASTIGSHTYGRQQRPQVLGHHIYGPVIGSRGQFMRPAHLDGTYNTTKPRVQLRKRSETRQLPRARSLASVAPNGVDMMNQLTNENHWTHGNRELYGTHQNLSDATLSGQTRDRMLRDKLNHRQRKHYFGTNLDQESKPTKLAERSKTQSFTLKNNLEDICTSDSDNAEIFDKLSKKQVHKPKLILKSIEDSYITNFTEIYEQEYKSRDTTRPLSLAQWRSLTKDSTAKNLISHNESDRQESSENQRPNEHSANDTMDDAEQNDSDEQKYNSGQNNFRSLTELDVADFAKSLSCRNNNLVIEAKPETSGLKQSNSVDQLLSGQVKVTDLDVKSSGGETKSDLGIKVGPLTGDSESPDFIVSADYICSTNVIEDQRLEQQQHQRLELGSPKSCSYV